MREYSDPECRHKLPLRFDFAVFLGELRLIEFQGWYHYNVVGGKDKNFAELQRRDAIKKEFCEQKLIPLLLIPHWESASMFDKIEKFLSE